MGGTRWDGTPALWAGLAWSVLGLSAAGLSLLVWMVRHQGATRVSTLLMAKAYPNSTFKGFDFHGPSIETARQFAREQGLSDRVSFDIATAQDFPACKGGYDLITFFECLHDLGDPGLALRRASGALADDGSCLIVEPNASANPVENVTLAGRRFAASSVSLCPPVAIAQHGQYALGNHGGEEVMRRIAEEAGLSDWRLATETPVNRIYQVKH